MPERTKAELDRLNRESNEIYEKNLKEKPLGDQRAIQFNMMQKWYDSLDPAGDVEIDMMIGNTRVRGFGSSQKAKDRYNQEWGKTNPIKEPDFPAGLSISSPVPEIWIPNLKKDANGNLVFPPHIMIHEMEHTIKQKDPRFQDPHQGIRNESYIPQAPAPEPSLFQKWGWTE